MQLSVRPSVGRVGGGNNKPCRRRQGGRGNYKSAVELKQPGFDGTTYIKVYVSVIPFILFFFFVDNFIKDNARLLSPLGVR